MDYQEGLEVPKVYSDIEIYSMEDLGDYGLKWHVRVERMFIVFVVIWL